MKTIKTTKKSYLQLCIYVLAITLLAVTFVYPELIRTWAFFVLFFLFIAMCVKDSNDRLQDKIDNFNKQNKP